MANDSTASKYLRKRGPSIDKDRLADALAAAVCSVCGGHGVEEVYGGHGTVLEIPCSVCALEDKKR